MDAMTKLNSAVDEVRGDVASLTGESKSLRETVVSLVGRMRSGSDFRSMVPEAFADDVATRTLAEPIAQDNPNPPMGARILQALTRVRVAITGGSRP
jgi:hypothetical protein